VTTLIYWAKPGFGEYNGADPKSALLGALVRGAKRVARKPDWETVAGAHRAPKWDPN
jgi:hypothetical protein